MKSCIFCIFLSFIFLTELTFAQTEPWKTLLNVKSEQQRDAHIPRFESKQKNLDGKEITLTGYMYAFEEAPRHMVFMLSYYPVASCYFCGGAGPESVMEVNMKKPVKFVGYPITLKGTLRLNATDPERLFYILLQAEIVED